MALKLHMSPHTFCKHARILLQCLKRHSVVVQSRRFAKDSEDFTCSERVQDPLEISRRALSGKRRPLSPLERVSQLLPQDCLSTDVWDLRSPTHTQGDTGDSPEPMKTIEEDKGLQAFNSTCVPGERPLHVDTGDSPFPMKTIGEEKGPQAFNSTCVLGEKPLHVDVGDSPDPMKTIEEEKGRQAFNYTCVPGERPLRFGEYLMVRYRRNRETNFLKMFELKEGKELASMWGSLAHKEIEGRPAGSVIHTSRGFPLLIHRPSLEEFVVHMKRGPVIAYPKDVSAMLTMMDVTEGDCVLDSGSGTGAMSLFLSRAVGSKGSVLSVEIRKDHHRIAALNYQRWRTTWHLRRGEEWPDNVHFHHGDLISAGPLLTGKGFNSVALDMISPHLVLPIVVPHLHPGSICTLYQAKYRHLERSHTLPVPIPNRLPIQLFL
ncbi:hypothetical protein DNTS_014862 [Danionella cerebrum]|uniref:tRNA (adenine(58)-N(1))-methyltransferase n=1 Tax=Danionella cerebrum TaxID=2873325 RepID=A0A553RI85_9TELE|nr:hypothetical protein DNTS_014862 [Danionella translucida]